MSYRTITKRGLLLVAAVCFALSLPTAAEAQRTEKDDPNRKTNSKVLAAFRDVVAKPSQCTVRVQCDGKDTVLGTVVGADGWILTKASDLKGKIVCKLKDSRQLDARIVGVHEAFDLALLKVEAKGLTPVEWCESKCAPVGNWVASVGLGDEPVAVGVVSVAARVNKIDPSRSGYLGVQLDTTGTTAKITRVEANTPAAKAGLKVDDVVLSVNGKDVTDAEMLINTIQTYKPGDTVTVKVKRGDQEVEVKATLDKRPASSARADLQNRMGNELSNRRTGFPVFLQHDTVLKPGDCGGPLVDLDGKVIGINIARAGRVESHAVPSEAVQPLLLDLMSGKLAPVEVKETKPLTPAEKVALYKAALQKAEADLEAAAKKVQELKALLAEVEAKEKEEKKPEK